MLIASQFSVEKKLLPQKDFDLIKKHYNDLNLPMSVEKKFNRKEINKIIYFMKKDKKNLNNKINLILLKKIGKTTMPNTYAIDANEIKKFLLKTYY